MKKHLLTVEATIVSIAAAEVPSIIMNNKISFKQRRRWYD